MDPNKNNQPESGRFLASIGRCDTVVSKDYVNAAKALITLSTLASHFLELLFVGCFNDGRPNTRRLLT